MSMTKFIYNNTKNISLDYTFLKLNYEYHLYVFSEEDIDLCLKSHSAKKLAKELKSQMSICQQNLIYTQKLQKLANNKKVMKHNYALGKKA